jgi:hypothetical protein
MTASATHPASAPDAAARTARLRRRALTVAAAVLAAVAVWVAAVPLAGVTLEAPSASGAPAAIGLVPVIVSGLMASLLGWGALALAERFVPRGRLVWTVVAAVLLLLSMAPVPTATTTGGMVTIALLHLAVGVPLIVGLTRAPAKG